MVRTLINKWLFCQSHSNQRRVRKVMIQCLCACGLGRARQHIRSTYSESKYIDTLTHNRCPRNSGIVCFKQKKKKTNLTRIDRWLTIQAGRRNGAPNPPKQRANPPAPTLLPRHPTAPRIRRDGKASEDYLILPARAGSLLIYVEK